MMISTRDTGRVLRIAALLLSLGLAAACGKAEEEDKGLERPPDVTQEGANLIWQRCPVGMTWDGWDCTGAMKRFRHADVGAACPPGYRLPAREELVSLLVGCDGEVKAGKAGKCKRCSDSELCKSMFDTYTDYSWTTDENDAETIWGVCFDCGTVIPIRKEDRHGVRCVKSDA